MDIGPTVYYFLLFLCFPWHKPQLFDPGRRDAAIIFDASCWTVKLFSLTHLFIQWYLLRPIRLFIHWCTRFPLRRSATESSHLQVINMLISCKACFLKLHFNVAIYFSCVVFTFPRGNSGSVFRFCYGLPSPMFAMLLTSHVSRSLSLKIKLSLPPS